MAIDSTTVAVGLANEVPPEVAGLLEPLANIIVPVLGTMSWLFGGIFGLYLILLLFRVYYDHKKVKLMKKIHEDVAFLREHSVATHFEKEKHLVDHKQKKTSRKKSKK